MNDSKKAMQLSINEAVEKALVSARAEYFVEQGGWIRLRTCSAYVTQTDNYYLLRSYYTIVAVIDKRTDTCYDALRCVYDYTATSAQHISKFMHDYGQGKWGCANRLTWR